MTSWLQSVPSFKILPNEDQVCRTFDLVNSTLVLYNYYYLANTFGK